jgi:S-adenosyl-L-methionine hydrolase (adenosine-forming)
MYSYITFLTDFGLQDDFAGVCRGVIKRIARDVQIVDITHGIAAQNVMQGALVLERSMPFMPVAVHLAVVDPGVGGDRRAVAIRTGDGRIFVGPDNGLLSLAADAASIVGVRELTNPGYHLDPVSTTFHARDIFAPVSAHLANGASFDDLGLEVDPAALVRIDVPEPVVGATRVVATVLAIDRFGNLQLNLRAEHIADAGLSLADHVELVFEASSYFAVVAETFVDAHRGDLLVYEDSYGAYSIAISNGDASKLTMAEPGHEVTIVPR